MLDDDRARLLLLLLLLRLRLTLFYYRLNTLGSRGSGQRDGERSLLNVGLWTGLLDHPLRSSRPR